MSEQKVLYKLGGMPKCPHCGYLDKDKVVSYVGFEKQFHVCPKCILRFELNNETVILPEIHRETLKEGDLKKLNKKHLENLKIQTEGMKKIRDARKKMRAQGLEVLPLEGFE